MCKGWSHRDRANVREGAVRSVEDGSTELAPIHLLVLIQQPLWVMQNTFPRRCRFWLSAAVLQLELGGLC